MKSVLALLIRAALAAIAAVGICSCQSSLGEVDPASRAAWERHLRLSPLSNVPGDDSDAEVRQRAAALRAISGQVQHGFIRGHILETAEWYAALPRVADNARTAYNNELRRYGLVPPVAGQIGKYAFKENEDDGLNWARGWFGSQVGEALGTMFQRSQAADARTAVLRPYAEHMKELSGAESFINSGLGIPDSYLLADRMAAINPRRTAPPVGMNFSGGFAPGMRLRFR